MQSGFTLSYLTFLVSFLITKFSIELIFIVVLIVLAHNSQIIIKYTVLFIVNSVQPIDNLQSAFVDFRWTLASIVSLWLGSDHELTKSDYE